MSPPDEQQAASEEPAATTNPEIPSASFKCILSAEEAERSIQDFCQFLRFETVSSLAVESGAYRECALWLKSHIENTVPCLDQVFLLPEAPRHSPVVVARWKGRDEQLPVLLLNSHYDVVPAPREAWTVPPFEAVRRDGKIYGRGAQDMKCVCIQYISALRYIHEQNQDWTPERSIYLTFVPDEEVGGSGMAAFLDSSLYKALPGVALALDEGLASTNEVFSVFYGERLPWWVDITAVGPTGHGSRFIDDTAVEQLLQLTQKALAFRKGQRDRLGMDSNHENCTHVVAAANQRKAKPHTLGDVTSLNITTLEAGVKVGNSFAYNCVPPTARCSLDIRISPHTTPADIGAMLDQWCQECSKNTTNVQGVTSKISWKFIGERNDAMEHAVTPTDKTVNPWYAVFEAACNRMGYQIEAQVFPAATDSRFLRALGIRALGFSPMRLTQIMLHENDEYIPERTFLEGIGVYVGLLKELASQGRSIDCN